MAAENDPEAWVGLDSSFHAGIARASGNKVFESVVADIRDALAHQSETLNMVADRQHASDEEHRRILAAIEAGDAATPRVAMSQHLHAVGVALDSILSPCTQLPLAPQLLHATLTQVNTQRQRTPCLPRPAGSHSPSAPAAAAALPAARPLAVQTRDGLVESVHYGSLIATAADGRTLLSAGEPLAAFYPRSALKPLQAVAMVRAGLDLPADLLALAAASHSGAALHRDGAGRILDLHGLTPAALENSTDLPYGVREREEWLCATAASPPSWPRTARESTPPWPPPASSTAGRCRATWTRHTRCRSSWPRPSRELTGEEPAGTSTDGCGTPLFALTLARHGPRLRPPGRRRTAPPAPPPPKARKPPSHTPCAATRRWWPARAGTSPS